MDFIDEFKSITNNILLQNWSFFDSLPPFHLINVADFEDVLKYTVAKNMNEIQTLIDTVPIDKADFDNIIAPFDRSGEDFHKAFLVYHNLIASKQTDELQIIERKMTGFLAQSKLKIYMMPGLFDRIEAVYNKRYDSKLNKEQIRLVERFRLDFVREGALFDSDAKIRYSDMAKELAELYTQFTQNLIKDESLITLQLSEDDLDGLPQDVKNAAKQAALQRKVDDRDCFDGYVITLSRSLVVPFLTFSNRQDLREKAWKLWTHRGELDPQRDNLQIAERILKLRHEQALMHGYPTYADFATADTMAGTTARVMELLEKVWKPAKDSMSRERDELIAYIQKTSNPAMDINDVIIEPWDWRYYAEKVRQLNYSIDDNEVKPYFPLHRMVAALFDCAKQLFGLIFILLEDIISYHPDVLTYEVWQEINAIEEDPSELATEYKIQVNPVTGSRLQLIAYFLRDNYARPMKQSGAWMSVLRQQTKNTSSGKPCIPIVMNNTNFNKGMENQPTLLSFTEATTLFHEFGHGLHGMLSNVTYKRLQGTSVLRDFVELPSQLFEHWLSEPIVLQKHAKHYLTDEPIPLDLMDRLMKAKAFNEGFNTVEYTASALVDIALHQRFAVELEVGEEKGLDQSTSNEWIQEKALDPISRFERNELTRLMMPREIVMRHRPGHFQHLFSSSAYAGMYYVYIWAEVLEADGFNAFTEAEDCFDPQVAYRVRKYIYSSGNSMDPVEAFKLFRGRDAVLEPMLKQRGLL